MRIENSDSISTNVNMNPGSSANSTALTRKVTAIDTDKAGNMQKLNKDWSQTSTKNISQINEYERDSMPVSKRVVIEAIEKANKAISGGNRRFEFSIHDKTNEIVVKVFDSQTDELIREIPNEKILDMVAKICEMVGILVDERR